MWWGVLRRGSWVNKLGSRGQEEDVPEDVYAGVDQGGGEDGIGFAPGPAVEEACDGGEEDVAPVGEVLVVGDVGKAEEDGGGDPASGVAVGGAREKILQEAAEEKFFRPGSEKKNGDRERKEGFPFVDVRGVDEEVDFQTERNDYAGDEDERAEDVEGPVGAPGDVVADAFAAAEEKKSCDGDVDA